MRVSTHDNIAFSSRVPCDGFDVVDHVNLHGTDSHNFRFGNPLRPWSSVIVSANRNHGRQRFQLIENFSAADVAGMQNQTHVTKNFEHLGPQ